MTRRSILSSVLLGAALALGLLLAGCGQGEASSATDVAATQAHGAPASTAAQRKKHKCRPVSEYAYDETVACHLKRAGKFNRRIDRKCGSYVAGDFSDPTCGKVIANYYQQLQAVRRHLRQVGVPPFLRKADKYLKRAVRRDLQAANVALEAIDTRNLGEFLRAWGMHGQAGMTLLIARDKLVEAWNRLWR